MQAREVQFRASMMTWIGTQSTLSIIHQCVRHRRIYTCRLAPVVWLILSPWTNQQHPHDVSLRFFQSILRKMVWGQRLGIRFLPNSGIVWRNCPSSYLGSVPPFGCASCISCCVGFSCISCMRFVRHSCLRQVSWGHHAEGNNLFFRIGKWHELANGRAGTS